MEVSARLRLPSPASTAPPRRGGGSLRRLLPLAQPASRAVSAKVLPSSPILWVARDVACRSEASLPVAASRVEWKVKKVRGDRGGGVRAAAGRAGGGPVGAAGAGGRGGQASPMAGRATRAGGRRQARLGPPGRCLQPLRRGLRRVRRLLPR
ncbi:uncharacterized protein [Triticum aestivum]|uniref:uncharacterized protein isoform X2 n=1 Tax=Triticum aestivum TaxID=4565 RepID=UPI001D0327B2|nr:uncharacterized protein LOC123150382 isoform X2 [Triticum aestivum]